MSNIEKLEVQFGSKGPEIHPAGDTGGDMVIADVNPDGVLTPEHADIIAYQMAAAPDLQDACETAIKFLDSMTSGIGLTSEKENKQVFRTIVEQALAKAKSCT